MDLFTERHGMRIPIERVFIITVEMYDLLFDCCVRYYNNIAWKFPAECDDGQGCYGLDLQQFNTHMKFDIPSLFRDERGWISKPSNNYSRETTYDQYALLDLIEFIGQNCRDIERDNYHKYFAHWHLNLLDTNEVFNTFRNEINSIFQKTGLLYALTDTKMVERVLEYSVLTPEVEMAIDSVKEKGLRDLLGAAVSLFKQPKPDSRMLAVEKLWDAFERLKSNYTELDKKSSIRKIIDDMSGGQEVFRQLFDAEFNALSNTGNNYRIRHHETDKTDITDSRHVDYFFNRCLALIAVAIQYLPKQ